MCYVYNQWHDISCATLYQAMDGRGNAVSFPEKSRTLFAYKINPDPLRSPMRLPKNGYRALLPWDKHSRSGKLTTYLQSVSWLRNGRTKPLGPLHAFMVCMRANLPFPFNGFPSSSIDNVMTLHLTSILVLLLSFVLWYNGVTQSEHTHAPFFLISLEAV